MILRVFDGDEIREEMPYSKDEMCYGARTSCTGEMCGGCCGCIALQCEYYGTQYEIVDE